MVMSDHHGPIRFRQVFERFSHAGVSLACGDVGAVVGGLGFDECAEVFHIETFDKACPMPTMGAHHHEGFVGGDAKQPGGKTRITTKRRYFANDLHQRALQQVLSVFFGNGITGELSFHVGANAFGKLFQGLGIPGLGVGND